MAAHSVHCLTDFVWHSPGNMLLILSFAAVGLATARLTTAASTTATYPGGRVGGLVGLACVCAAAVLFVPDAYARVQAEPHVFELARIHMIGDIDGIPKEDTRSLELVELLAAREHNPNDAEVNARLGKLMLDTFNDRQRASGRFNLANLRDTSRSFPSAAEAVTFFEAEEVAGRNFQAVQAARSLALRGIMFDPLHIDCWRRLAETQFIVDVRAEATTPLVDQMLAAQPHSAKPHYEAAIAALLKQDVPAAIDHWRIAFRQDEKLQLLVAIKLAAVIPANEFLETLKPGPRSLHRIQGVYLYNGREDEERVLTRALGQQWEMAASEGRSSDVVEKLKRSCAAYRRAEDLESAERTARRAVEVSPTSVVARSALGETLRDQERWAEAAEHLLWCSRMRPDDDGLRDRASFCVQKSRQRETLIANPHELPIR